MYFKEKQAKPPTPFHDSQKSIPVPGDKRHSVENEKKQKQALDISIKNQDKIR